MGTPSTAGFGAELRRVTLSIGAAAAGAARAAGRSSRANVTRVLIQRTQILEFIWFHHIGVKTIPVALIAIKKYCGTLSLSLLYRNVGTKLGSSDTWSDRKST